MGLADLDRQQWRFDEAVEYVTGVLRASAETAGDNVLPLNANRAPWQKPADPAVLWREAAEKEVLVALRDGDLHASGRLSTERIPPYRQSGPRWELHSGHHTSIAPETWRGGRCVHGRLEFADGEYVDIRMPRFMVRATWPPVTTTSGTSRPESEEPYTTPYLELLNEAIAHFAITETRQPKKESLVMWFRDQTIEGEPISENLASVMATLVRTLESQRGGAKRAFR